MRSDELKRICIYITHTVYIASMYIYIYTHIHASISVYAHIKLKEFLQFLHYFCRFNHPKV